MPIRGTSVSHLYMPVSAAPPHRSAHSDHRMGAGTPREAGRSNVDGGRRGRRAEARCMGPEREGTTGSVHTVMARGQHGNCSGGTIDRSATGVVNIAEMIRRLRSAVVASPSGLEVSYSAAVV